MDSNHRCLGVGQKSSPLDHGINLKVDSSGIAPESSVCRTDVFLLDHEPDCDRHAEAVGLEPTSGSARRLFSSRSCYRGSPSSFLSVGGEPCFQPDDFRDQTAGVGIEPTPPGSEPSVTASSNYPARRSRVQSLESRARAEVRIRFFSGSRLSTLRSRLNCGDRNRTCASGVKAQHRGQQRLPRNNSRGTGGTRTHARVLNKHLLCR